MIELDNILVIIRSCEERTSKLVQEFCHKYLSSQNIFIIYEQSFGEAHGKCLEIFSNSDKSFAVFLDADIIPKKDFFLRIINSIKRYEDKDWFMLNFPVFDFHWRCKTYGVHVYRNPLIQKAKKLYDESCIYSIKPETSLCKKMALMKHYTYNIRFEDDSYIGFHGFEQSFVDIYRTSYVRAYKMKSKLSLLLANVYAFSKEKNFLSEDYECALLGVLDGIEAQEHQKETPVLIKEKFVEIFNEKNLESKFPKKETLCADFEELYRRLNSIKEISKEIQQLHENYLYPQKLDYNYNYSRTIKMLKKIKRNVFGKF